MAGWMFNGWKQPARKSIPIAGLLLGLSSLRAAAAVGSAPDDELKLATRIFFACLALVAVVILLAWMQARYRRRLERSNAELRRSEEEARRALSALEASERQFRLLFENSADAILLFDPEKGVFVDCNEAAVQMTQGGTRDWLLSQSPEALSAGQQPDGESSAGKIRETIRRALGDGPQRVEWLARRFNGEELLMDVLATSIQSGGRRLLVVVGRDITLRRQSEERVRQLNLELERRVQERTDELAASEARLRTLVDNAPEAIVVYDADTRRFVNCNENAVELFGLDRETLLASESSVVSPPIQPDGRQSDEVLREKVAAAMSGEAPVFEWTTLHSSGRQIPCEVRLVRLPAEGQNLIRGSIIDDAERRQREKTQLALYEISEAVHTAGDLDHLFQRIHSIIKELMPAKNFYLALYDSVTDRITFPYHVDEIESMPSPRRPGSNLTDYVLRTGRPLLADHDMMTRRRPVNDPVPPGEEPHFVQNAEPAAVWLGVPLVVGGKTIGVMTIQDYDNPSAYGEEEMKILMFVAGQVGVAIERKRTEQALYKRTEQIRRHRNVLLELAQLEKSHFTTALARICQLSAHAIEVGRVSYWSLRDDNTALECELLFLGDANREDKDFRGTRVEAAVCPAYFDAVASKHPIIAVNAEATPATAELAESYLRPLGISSLLDVPVWVHGRLVGVLCHEHVGSPREWTVEEVDFASSLGTMISLSLEADQRARSELALRESEAKFRALFEATSQGVMLHDEDTVIEVNSTTLRILGFSNPADMIGHHLVDFAPPTQPDGQSSDALISRHIAQCMEQGSGRFELTALSRDRHEVPLEVILTRIPMRGRPIIQAVINDITERKKAEAELLKSLAREKELSQLKSNFVAMVSHEFRTPLGVILSSSEILDTYFDRLDPTARREHVESIQKNVQRMKVLMEEVLLLGQVEAGRLDFKPVPFDLQGFFSRLTEEMLSATNRVCPITLSNGDPFPKARTDERLLRHIFTNLLSNAVKYSPPGTPVEVEVRREGPDAVCRVTDWGIGIPDSDLPWLFQAFQRGRNVGNRSGSGLGLVIVKRCVELHQGRIDVRSKVGKGTTFIVRLPVFNH